MTDHTDARDDTTLRGTTGAGSPDPSRRTARRGLALGLAATLVAGAAVTGVIWGVSTASADSRLQPIVDRLVAADYPAAVASLTSPSGDADEASAGVADLETRDAVPEDGEVRIGSATKTFTAVVALQLAEEGLLDLDAPIEQYLPGVIRGEGVDASAISARQLLQHTSGLPEYGDLVAADPFAVRDSYRSPRDMVDFALQRPADFAPGERHQYSNTGYLVLGLLIERLSERPLAEQIHDRIIEPLELEHTYLPVPGEREIRGDHPNGYHVDGEGELRDLSSTEVSWAWAAGGMVSTPSELNLFMQAVVAGELLEPAMLDQMLTGIPTGEELLPGSEYGLGIESMELSCGTAWGHSGDIPGFQTRNGVGPDGSAFTVTVTALPWAVFQGSDDELTQRYLDVIDTIDEALCPA